MKSGTQNETYIESCLAELETVKKNGDVRKMALAYGNLGAAYLLDRKLKPARENFSAGDELIDSLGDETLEAEYLKVKCFAQQVAGHLADAYRGAERIYEIGRNLDNAELMCDALASQGQIQLDSADPITASEKLQQALEIAADLGDKRRIMTLQGAQGNLSLAVAATDKALKQFYQARSLAVELGDEKSEIGFSGNIGTLLAFQRKHKQAVGEFEKILHYVESKEDLDAHIQALRYLCQSHDKLENHQAVLEYAQRGIELGDRKDHATTLFFYEKMILALYKLNDLENAQRSTQEAIKIATRMKDKTKQVELLIGLGESFTLSEAYPQALEVYRQAREGARRLQQFKNEAYLVGRIGVVLAEMGELDQAVVQHEEALSLARARKIADLEGEQLSMLAMACLEKGDRETAASYAEKSLQVFLDADLLDESERARSLITHINHGRQE